MTEQTVLTHFDEGVATVTLNRPERRNAMAGDMLDRLYEALKTIARDRDIAVVILRGAGADFCPGADIKAFPEGIGETDYRRVSRLYHIATVLHEMPQITLAAIDGACAGAGLGWAAACDLRFASERAAFATAFIKVGVAGDMGTAWSLSRLIGPSKARELMLFSEKFHAAEALEMGLVTRVFPADALHARTMELARELAGRSRLALEAIKANFLAAERLGLRDYVDLEGARHGHVTRSDETTVSFRSLARGAE